MSTQQIFTLFFAIFWSIVANAQPKWKAFQYTFFLRIWQTTFRIIISFLILNILPILYFCTILWLLRNDVLIEPWTQNTLKQIVLHGIVPAFAIFGFYRIWISFIEFFPRFFYRENVNGTQYPSDKIEPTLKSLEIPTDYKHWVNAIMNLIWGLIYIGVAYFSATRGSTV